MPLPHKASARKHLPFNPFFSVWWLTWQHRRAAPWWGWGGDWTRRCRTAGGPVLPADFPWGWRWWPHWGRTPCRAMPRCRTTPAEVDTSIKTVNSMEGLCDCFRCLLATTSGTDSFGRGQIMEKDLTCSLWKKRHFKKIKVRSRWNSLYSEMNFFFSKKASQGI